MIKTLVALLASSLALTRACAPRSTGYLSVALWDNFGDGWGDAYWISENPAGDLTTEQPECEELLTVTIDPCANAVVDGSYSMAVARASLNGSQSEAYWEIYWRVSVYDSLGNLTGYYVEGSFGTSMTWAYTSATDEWSLAESSETIEPHCEACVEKQCNNDISTDLTVKMKGYSEEWEDASPLGARWVVSNADNTAIVETGALCSDEDESEKKGNKKHTYCNVCLPDGSYIFRASAEMSANDTAALAGSGSEHALYTAAPLAVAGGEAHNNCTDSSCPKSKPKTPPRHKAWEFCYAKGTFGDQLTFHVQDGECYPDVLLWPGEACNKNITSTVTALGVVSLSGCTSDKFYSGDYDLVLSALADSIGGWEITDMAVISTHLDKASSSEQYSSFVHEITYTASFVAEELGIDGSIYSAVEDLVANMRGSLLLSISSGEFVERLATLAGSADHSELKFVTGSDVKSLEIDSIEYTGNRLEIKEKKKKKDKSSKKSLSDLAVGTIVVVASIGAFAAVAMFVQSAPRLRPTHDPVPTSSESRSGNRDLNVFNPLMMIDSDSLDSDSASEPERHKDMNRPIRPPGSGFKRIVTQADERDIELA